MLKQPGMALYTCRTAKDYVYQYFAYWRYSKSGIAILQYSECNNAMRRGNDAHTIRLPPYTKTKVRYKEPATCPLTISYTPQDG